MKLAYALFGISPGDVGLTGSLLVRPTHKILIEVATTQEEKLHGLSDRTSISLHTQPATRGMYFPDVQAIQMRRMRFGLDILFLDESSRISGIVQAAMPGNSTFSFQCANVLELPLGWTLVNGTKLGHYVNVVDA